MTRNLLLTGGPGHDFDAIAGTIVRLLQDEGIETTVVTGPEEMVNELSSTEAAGDDRYDLLTVHALRWGMAAERYAHLRDEHSYTLGPEEAAVVGRFVHAGGGLLALHGAVICFDAQPAWRELCGASWNWDSSSHPPLDDAAIEVTAAGRCHPITRDLDDFTMLDEVYGFLDEDREIVPLLTGEHGGRTHPVLWAREVGDGRAVTDVLGHGVESVDHPIHRTILRRAAVWARRGRSHGC